MRTVDDLLRLSTEFLTHRSIEHARREAEELLAHVLRTPRMDLYLQLDRSLTEEEKSYFWEKVRKRGQRMPLGYIIGQVEFLGSWIEVSPAVLIPRQETELLAYQILQELPSRLLPSKSFQLWDVCCGSGCVGISLKKQRPDLHVTLSDLSSAALEVASHNAALNRVSVELRQGDLLTPFQGLQADVVVCNPPYIAQEVYETLEPEVKEWEPLLALVGGATGYEFYARLASTLPAFVAPGGLVYLEIGAGMGHKVQQMMESPAGVESEVKYWEALDLFYDGASHERWVRLKRGPTPF